MSKAIIPRNRSARSVGVAGNPATGDTLNQRTAPPRVCCTVKLRPASTWCSPRLGT